MAIVWSFVQYVGAQTTQQIENSTIYQDGTGNIGIGTAAPGSYKLNVNGVVSSGATFTSYIADGLFGATALPGMIGTPGGQTIRFGYWDNSGGQYSPRIGFNQIGPATPAQASIGLNPINGDFTFNNSAANAERMRIAANGYVGIGTTAPGSKLSVSDSGASGLEMGPIGGLNNGPYLQGYNRTSPGSYVDISYYGNTHNFWASGYGWSLFVANNGNIGIGIPLPSAGLQINKQGVWGSLVINNQNGSMTHFNYPNGNNYFRGTGNYFTGTIYDESNAGYYLKPSNLSVFRAIQLVPQAAPGGLVNGMMWME